MTISRSTGFCLTSSTYFRFSTGVRSTLPSCSGMTVVSPNSAMLGDFILIVDSSSSPGAYFAWAQLDCPTYPHRPQRTVTKATVHTFRHSRLAPAMGLTSSAIGTTVCSAHSSLGPSRTSSLAQRKVVPAASSLRNQTPCCVLRMHGLPTSGSPLFVCGIRTTSPSSRLPATTLWGRDVQRVRLLPGGFVTCVFIRS